MTTKVEWQPTTKGQRTIVTGYIEKEVDKLLGTKTEGWRAPNFVVDVVYIESMTGVKLAGKRFGVILNIGKLSYFIRTFVIKYGLDLVQVVDVFHDSKLLFNENDLTISPSGDTASTHSVRLVAHNIVKIFEQFYGIK